MSDPIIVEVERSGFVESTHLVDVAVVDEAGRLIASAEDPERPAAFRSSSKPIQARVCLENGWDPDELSLAIACASHNGEPAHIAQVRAILGKAGITEDHLRCPPDVPAHPDAALKVTTRAALYHYCSGKHAAMLATSAVNGWRLDTYHELDHPLQKQIRARINALTGTDAQALVDGCGVPTFVAPLAALARAFGSIDDGGPEAKAMRANPFLVAGTDQLDTELMEVAPQILVKYGAEGVVCASAKGHRIALKSRDGLSARARGPATLLMLDSLGLLDDGTLAKLQHQVQPAVRGGGEPVGRVRARGSLGRAER